MKVLRFLLLVATAGSASLAHSFCTEAAGPAETTVREYYETATDRYFLGWTHYIYPGSCVFATANEPVPSGALPTGLAWTTYPYAGYCSRPDDCSARSVDLCQFLATSQPGSPSRFVTIDAGECLALKSAGSGWVHEPAGPFSSFGPQGKAGLAAFPPDRDAGACPGGTVPVHRFYNNRYAENLSNHRYVADEAVRLQMRSKAGWIDEGIAFCALSASRHPATQLSLWLATWYPLVGGRELACSNGFATSGRGACVEAVNMAMPPAGWGPFAYGGSVPDPMPTPYVDRTGMSGTQLVTYAFGTDEQSAEHSFVNLHNSRSIAGLYVTSYDRIVGSISGMRIWRRVDLALSRPFAIGSEVEMDLVLTYRLFVRQATARSPGSGGYAIPMATFRDVSSGGRLSLGTGSFGTVPAGDFTGRDGLTGDPVVSIALGSAPSIGRSFGIGSLHLLTPFVSSDPSGRGGDVVYRINRAEFRAVIARARTVDPGLSADPGDYEIDGFGVKGEVAGDADIGFNVQRMELSVVRP